MVRWYVILVLLIMLVVPVLLVDGRDDAGLRKGQRAFVYAVVEGGMVGLRKGQLTFAYVTVKGTDGGGCVNGAGTS